MTEPKTHYTTKEKADLYDTVSPLLTAAYTEVKELAKKKPEGTLNANKVKVLNRLLKDIRIVLDNEPSSKYLDMLDDDDLPLYSDVVLMLSQYSAALKHFRAKYHGWDGSKHQWFTK